MRRQGPPVFCANPNWNFDAVSLIERVKCLTGKVKARFLLNFAIGLRVSPHVIEEESARKISNVAVAATVAIALYFALAWGYDGLRILTSPSYGLEDVWRSQFVFAIGRLFNLGPIGLIKLAAFFGALKPAVACICVIHIANRFHCMMLSLNVATCGTCHRWTTRSRRSCRSCPSAAQNRGRKIFLEIAL